MGNKKPTSPIKLIAWIIVCLAVSSYWLDRSLRNDSRPETPKDLSENISGSASNNNAPNQDLSSNEGSREERILGQNVPALQQTENVNSSDQQNPPSEQKKNTVSGPDAAQSQNPYGNNQSNSVATLNPIQNDEQIMARISLQNQKTKELNQALTDRINKINEVHQAILASGVGDSSEVKPFVAPLLTPPDDIAAKLKSHQLVGH